MTDQIVTTKATATRTTPIHLWIVGIVSLLWNAFGAFDYLMTQTRNESYMSSFSEEQLTYFYGFPAWMEAFWALGVWGAVAGSVLLLARSRFALHAFVVSLVGLVGSSVYSFFLSEMPSDMNSSGYLAFTIAIYVVTIALIVYAWRMIARNVLR